MLVNFVLYLALFFDSIITGEICRRNACLVYIYFNPSIIDEFICKDYCAKHKKTFEATVTIGYQCKNPPRTQNTVKTEPYGIA